MFPDYGPTLADAFQTEAEMFFDSILREGRPLIDLLTANYTFVNEPLAKHYGMPQVKGIIGDYPTVRQVLVRLAVKRGEENLTEQMNHDFT